MTDTDDRSCVRGCTVKDKHFATCADFGSNGPGACRGCAPRVAHDGALLCERCYRSIARLLGEAPELITHLRTLTDPAKAARYDAVRVMTSKGEPPAPVSADLLDAANDVVRTLKRWSFRVNHPDVEQVPNMRLRAGTTAVEAAADVEAGSNVILGDLDRIANDNRQAQALGDAILGSSDDGTIGPWSLREVAARWPVADAERWADAPCPGCDLKTVQVIPSTGSLHRYVCRECEWEADSSADGGLWGDVFESTTEAAA